MFCLVAFLQHLNKHEQPSLGTTTIHTNNQLTKFNPSHTVLSKSIAQGKF